MADGPAPQIRCRSAGQGGDQFGRAVYFFLGVVVVRGKPDQGMHVAVLGVERVVPGHGGGHVNPGAAQGRGGLLRRYRADLGGDYRAADLAEVVDGDTGQRGELVPELGAQGAWVALSNSAISSPWPPTSSAIAS